MAQNDYTSLHGLTVKLHGFRGTFPSCRCGSTAGAIGPGISTHPGHLKCAACGKHLSWVGKDHMDALLAAQPKPKRTGAA